MNYFSTIINGLDRRLYIDFDIKRYGNKPLDLWAYYGMYFVLVTILINLYYLLGSDPIVVKLPSVDPQNHGE